MELSLEIARSHWSIIPKYLKQAIRLSPPIRIVTVCEVMDLTKEHGLVIPGKAHPKIRFHTARLPVGPEEGLSSPGKIRHPAVVPERYSLQLNEEIAKIQGRIAASAPVKIQDGEAPLVPE